MSQKFKDTPELQSFRSSLENLVEDNKVVFVLAQYGAGKTENTKRALSNKKFHHIDLSNATSIKSAFFIINQVRPYLIICLFMAILGLAINYYFSLECLKEHFTIIALILSPIIYRLLLNDHSKISLMIRK